MSKLKDNINSIISTGGGIVLKKENIDIMTENGTIIFLDIDVETQMSRIKNKKNRQRKSKNWRLIIEKASKKRIYKTPSNSSWTTFFINVS